MLAAGARDLLGADQRTVARWRSGALTPSAPAQALIRVLDVLMEAGADVHALEDGELVLPDADDGGPVAAPRAQEREDLRPPRAATTLEKREEAAKRPRSTAGALTPPGGSPAAGLTLRDAQAAILPLPASGADLGATDRPTLGGPEAGSIEGRAAASRPPVAVAAARPAAGSLSGMVRVELLAEALEGSRGAVVEVTPVRAARYLRGGVALGVGWSDADLQAVLEADRQRQRAVAANLRRDGLLVGLGPA